MWSKWRDLISEQGRSGQTIVAFCRDRGLTTSQFYTWRSRLRKSTAERFLEVQVVKTAARPLLRCPGAPRAHLSEMRLSENPPIPKPELLGAHAQGLHPPEAPPLPCVRLARMGDGEFGLGARRRHGGQDPAGPEPGGDRHRRGAGPEFADDGSGKSPITPTARADGVPPRPASGNRRWPTLPASA